MTKYILHGGFERKDTELNRTFYKELVRDVPDNATILLVYFAAEDHKVLELFEAHQKFIEAESPGKKFNFVIANEDDFLAQVVAAHVIHFRGGDTNKLLATLCAYPTFSELLEGKTVSGSSAGAYLLAAYGAAHSETKIRKGLGLVHVRVVCHYESAELPPSPESMSKLKAIATDLELVLLRDCEWKVFSQ